MKRAINALKRSKKTPWKKELSKEDLKKLKNFFHSLELKLKISFKNKKNLISAFCHRSFLNEVKAPFSSYENLEFLGDAVLSLIVAEYLYSFFQEKKEGELSYLRAFLVNRNQLADCAKKLDFDKYLLLSEGEELAGGRKKTSILADIFESFLGALYLDKGYKICKKFVEEYLISKLLDKIQKEEIKDPKTILQEKMQKLFGITPVYKTLKQWGPDHDKSFLVGVFLNEKEIGRGEGHSKKEASEKAAKNALELKIWENVEN